MTLIHDFHGDPNQTYYNSHLLAAGWLPGYPTYAVHTAEDTYQGNISVTKATVLSDNTVFAQLDADLDPRQGHPDRLRDGDHHASGLAARRGDRRPDPGVTPLEMADAYSTLANGGSHVPATIINKVVFPDGSVDNLGNPAHKRVFTDGEAYAATSVLKGVITSGTGTAAGYGCPAAGKTGTANNLANAWFVGYTPRMSTAVWVGYPQGNIPMANGFGGTLAAPIWHDYMPGRIQRLLRRVPAAHHSVQRHRLLRPLRDHRRPGHDAPRRPRRPADPEIQDRWRRRDRHQPVQQPDAVRPTAPEQRQRERDFERERPRPRQRPRELAAVLVGRGRRQEALIAGAGRAPAGSLDTARAVSPGTTDRTACRRKRKSSWKARWSRPCRTRCSASSSTTWTASCSATWPARCAASGSGILPGDRVRVELSPYDLDRARIVYRHR